MIDKQLQVRAAPENGGRDIHPAQSEHGRIGGLAWLLSN
jgi:hypothetical protein